MYGQFISILVLGIGLSQGVWLRMRTQRRNSDNICNCMHLVGFNPMILLVARPKGVSVLDSDRVAVWNSKLREIYGEIRGLPKIYRFVTIVY
jgi:hypothetical protein